jgi:hypothetical protein
MARELTRAERVRARHLLQVLSEQARAVRNAVEPDTGFLLHITDEVWERQWLALRKDLDAFTEQVKHDEPGVTLHGLGTDRNA